MATRLSLSSRISEIPSIGKVYQNKLHNLGIDQVSDLLYYFPFRYDDLAETKQISDLEIGDILTIKATLWQITKFRTKFGKTIIKAVVNDPTGTIDVIWFNQVYLLTVLKPNTILNLSGKVGLFSGKKTLINPKYEIIRDAFSIPIHTERLVPIYSESGNISSKWIRTKVHQLLSSNQIQVNDFLEPQIRNKEQLIDLKTALREIHFPTNLDLAKKARERLGFDELLLLHLRNLRQRDSLKENRPAIQFNFAQKNLAEFKKGLPFKLTDSQEKTIAEIATDLQSGKAMNRLLQGEVGSGKTVVSCFPIYACVLSGFQAALLAPTEILAKQHFKTISTFLGNKVKVELHTGSTKAKSDNFDVVVGTHALLNSEFKIKNLGLIVVDEQQRFGVLQRSVLKNHPQNPHFLTMTATPIPRTLALTLYGNLDISVLEEIPSGRKKVKTYFVPRYKREGAYDFVKKEINKGGQAFVICPLIEISETLVSVKSAKAEFDHLRQEIFPKYKLGLLHGRLKTTEKDQVVENFREGKIDILVSTPVVEVGIDIPNASIMLIEAAERFGLSSLHQLRGRVGRGERQSYCLIFSDNQNQNVIERLKLLEKFSNGLDLAEMDLEKRGPGDLLGTAQSGQFNLRLINGINLDLIVRSRKVAENIYKLGLKPEINDLIGEVENETYISD